MAIEGLRKRVAPSEKVFRVGTPDVDTAVKTSIEVFKTLDILDSEKGASADLTEQYNDLTKLGYGGRLYPELATNVVSFQELVVAAESKKPRGVADMYRYDSLWTPGTQRESYTNAELDGTDNDSTARIALFNTDQNTGVDPILHHLGMPYDGKSGYDDIKSPTQLGMIEADRIAFERAHEGYNLVQLGHRAFLTLALMDRIEGKTKSDTILATGFMRTELGRRSVGGGSIVGDVNSDGGQLGLDRSVGLTYSDDGVGLSAGPKA